jgi:hypothetical protein
MNSKRGMFKRNVTPLPTPSKEPWRHDVAISSVHAAATFDAFPASQAVIMERCKMLSKSNGGFAQRISEGRPWPTAYYDVFQGADGVQFEVGFDLADRDDGVRVLDVKILRVASEE